MNTVGYVMLFAAILIINSIARGRVMHLFEDLGDAFTAAITGDYAELKSVLTLSGDDLTAPTVVVGSDPAASGSVGTAGNLLSEMKRLAVIADNRYILGTTGPKSYDCSGLVWRACKNLGIYTGARFTTKSFPLAARGFAVTTDRPTVGDIVLWTNKHMGVVSGNDTFYSARNHKSGIGESRISTWPGSKPRYFRVNTSINPTKNGSGVTIS